MLFKAVETDAIVALGGFEEAHELALRRLECRVGHIIDEPDRKHPRGFLRAIELISARALSECDVWLVE